MITVSGADELIKKLKRLEKKDAKAACRKGCRAGAKIIAAQEKANAPSRTGALRTAIKVRAIARSKNWIGARVTVSAYYAGFQELGLHTTHHLEARKFGRSAAADKKTQAVATAQQIIAEQILESMK